MTIAYFDTASGIAGDMTLSALIDAGADVGYLNQQIQSLGLPDVRLEFSETIRHCFRAKMLTVHYPAEHAHRHLSDIEALIEGSQLTSRERQLALRMFRKLGAAEAKVHGTDIESVHFHEVGAVDSIVDIVGIAVAVNQLNISRIEASPTPTGCGTIHIAHGLVSVPAPATAELLKGVPIRSSSIPFELTTPTGAAFLSTLCDGFGPLPDMQITRLGYGAGHKDLAEQANLLRVFIGEPVANQQDTVCQLEANIDDASGEQIAFAVEQLWKVPGVLDVFTSAISMKKNRPAVLLSVLCRPEARPAVEDCFFAHTSTLGVRCNVLTRRKLHREVLSVETPFGSADVKVAWHAGVGDVSPRFSPEYDDCRRLANEHRTEFSAVFRAVIDAAESRKTDLVPPVGLTQNPENAGPWEIPSMVDAVEKNPAGGHDHHDHGGHDHHDHGGHDHHH